MTPTLSAHGTQSHSPIASHSTGEPNDADATDLQFRQLRRQTREALKQILVLVEQAPELRSSGDVQSLSKQLQKRILLAVSLSDALFGLTQPAETVQQRLAFVCFGVKNLLSDPGAEIDLRVSAHDECPMRLEEVVLRAAHDLVSNVILHGMHARLLGKIDVSLHSTPTSTTLAVSDDGWGIGDDVMLNDGVASARAIVETVGGSLQVQRRGGRTVATVSLPHGRAPML